MNISVFSRLVQVLQLLLAVPIWGESNPYFIEHPKNQTVFLDSTAEFSCKVTHAYSIYVYWSLDGTNVAPTRKMVANGVQHAVLSITGMEGRNNTVVFCIMYDSESEESGHSQSAHLQVQGLLASPAITIIHNVGYKLKIIWEPPYSLNVTNTEPDIFYYEIHIVDTYAAQTIIVNVTGVEYTEERMNELCQTLELAVLAVNGAGKGNISDALKVKLGGELQPSCVALTTELQGQVATQTAVVTVNGTMISTPTHLFTSSTFEYKTSVTSRNKHFGTTVIVMSSYTNSSMVPHEDSSALPPTSSSAEAETMAIFIGIGCGVTVIISLLLIVIGILTWWQCILKSRFETAPHVSEISPVYDTIPERPSHDNQGAEIPMELNSAYVIPPPRLKLKVMKNEAYSSVAPQHLNA